MNLRDLWLENSSTQKHQRSVTGEFVYPWISEICDWRIRLSINLRDLWLENSSIHEPQRSVTGEFVYLWTSEICDWRIRLPMNLRDLWLENSSTHVLRDLWLENSSTHETQRSVTGEFVYLWTSEISNWRTRLPMNTDICGSWVDEFSS